MKLRSLGILVITVILLNCNSVKALTGETDSGESPSASTCSAGWCISTGNYGVRISIVDKDGNVKGKALNIMIQLNNINVTKIDTLNRFPRAKDGYDVNEYYINDSKLGTIKNLLNNLIIMTATDNNYDSDGGVDSKIKKWKNGNETFKKIQELTGAKVSASDYLVVEPLTVTYKYGTTDYYYGTAKEIVAKIESLSSLNYGSRVFVLERAGKAMISIYHKITIPGIANDKGDRLIKFVQNKNTKDDVENNKSYWNRYTYGVAIYSLENLVNQCKIGVNDNSDTRYNWIKYDDKEEKYIPEKNGCCYNYEEAGISKEVVFSNYPQCFTDSDIDLVCLQINKASQGCDVNGGYSRINNKPKNLNACLASNKYQAGVIDRGAKIFYGCYYTDDLNFPKKYRKNLPLGGHFVWPTDDTLLQFRLTDLSYDLNRVSTAECFAYQINDKSGLFSAYSGLSQKMLDSIKNRIQKLIKTDNENMVLKQNGEVSGKLKYDMTNNIATLSKSTGYFNVTINGVYRQISDSPEAYRYYDNENLKYLQNSGLNKDKLTSYTSYPYMLLPIDRSWSLDKSYSYGIDYNTNFAGLKMSSSYTCNSKVTDMPSSTCICPSDTENAGLDLTNYYLATNHGTCKDVGKTAICSDLMDEYCNSKNLSNLKCPNQNKDLSGCVRQKLNADSNLSQMQAYNQCIYEECNCSGSNCGYKELCPSCENDESCPPNDKEIIYRPIFLENPFPSINGNIRYPGANWGGKNSLTTNKTYQGLVEKYITSTAKYMYEGEPMYSITLTPKTIKNIRNYNRNHKYDDFDLECDNGGKCYSTFLHKELSGYDSNVVNGTCGIINYKNQYYNDFEKCRLDSFSK